MEQTIANRKAFETLAAYFHGGRLPHALLVEGAKGADKGAFAREIARGALCGAPAGERPCGVCKHCVKAEKGIHPDILTYSGEGGAKSFRIDAVRAIRQEAYVRPNEADGKVLILENVQDMSIPAQNALLKIIEEPPPSVYFALTCENKAALLETILSRVAAISLDASADREEPEEDAEARDKARRVLLNACTGSEPAALAALTVYERDRPGLTALLEGMADILRTAMLRPAQEPDGELDRLISRAGVLRLLKILAIIEDTAYAVAQNANGLLVTTALCGRIRAAMTDE